MTFMKAVDPRLVEAIAEQLRRRPNANRVGWKLGIGDRERVGATVVVGHLTSATVLQPGAVYDVLGDALHADAEIAVEIGATGEIAAYAPALELVDLGGPRDDAYWAVVGNVFHRAVAFGDWTPAWPGELEAALVVNGAIRRSGTSTIDVGGRVAEAKRVLQAAGQSLEPGDRVITGNIVQVAVQAGDRIEADLGPLGSVSLDIR